jgi:hypothetical protein
MIQKSLKFVSNILTIVAVRTRMCDIHTCLNKSKKLTFLYQNLNIMNLQSQKKGKQQQPNQHLNSVLDFLDLK